MTYKHQNTFASQFGMALAGVPQQLLSALRANQLDYAGDATVPPEDAFPGARSPGIGFTDDYPDEFGGRRSRS